MRLTRKIVAEFIGVFLIGAVVGALIMWSITDTQISTFMSKSASKPDDIVARINKKYADTYHLTPDELNKIQPIIKDMAQHMYDIRHKFGSDMMSTLDAYHQHVAEQLTPEHRAAYEAATADRRKTLAPLLLIDDGSSGQPPK